MHRLLSVTDSRRAKNGWTLSNLWCIWAETVREQWPALLLPIYSTRANYFFPSLQSKPEYSMCYKTKISKRSLILILSSQCTFYRLNFWISASCLSVSLKYDSKWSHISSLVVISGHMSLPEYSTHYILACNLWTKADIKNLDLHICTKFIKGYGTKIWRLFHLKWWSSSIL